jgi:4-hydroxy-tetrahydrodipicolinate synthase
MRAMIDAFVAGDFEKADQLESILMPLASALFETTSPILIKKALEINEGFIGGGLRLPLVEATAGKAAHLKEVMDTTFAQLREVGVA